MKKLTCLVCFVLACLAAPAQAADVTLTASDGFGASSFNSAGGWSNLAAPSAGNAYFTGATYRLRTPTGTGSYTFAGDSLTINNTNGYEGGLMYKGTGDTATITVNNLILDGGQINHANASTDVFNLYGSLNVVSDSDVYAKQGPIHVYSVIGGSATITNPGSDGGFSILYIHSASNTFTGSIVNNGRLELVDDAVLNFVIGADGVNNSVTGTGESTVFNGDFVFDLTGAGTTLGDSWVIAGAGTQSFGETFTVVGFTDAGNNTWAKPAAGELYYEFDESTGILSVVWDVTFPPRNPNPADGAVNVPVATSGVSWVGSEIAGGLPDPNVLKYHIWTNEYNPASPDLEYQGEVAVGSTAAASYTFDVPLANDFTYYWKVEQAIDTGTGNPGDPNNISSPVWSFSTPLTLAVITGDPVNAKAVTDGSETVVFEVSYTSDVTVTDVDWFFNDVEVTSGVVWDQTSSTLTVAGVTEADLGTYYSRVYTVGGYSESLPAQLTEKKLLAWYQFEQNVNDSAGSNNGTLAGITTGMLYSTDQAGTFTGQSFAADPNGGVYAELPAGAYPKAGAGNGLDEGTITYWVKADAAEFGSIFGNYNGTPGGFEQITGIRTRVMSGGVVHFHIRDEDSNQINLYSTETVNDNQWHFVAATFDGTEVTLYVDSANAYSATASAPIDNFAAWQNPLLLLAINNRTDVQDLFSGMVDDLKIYNYTMTQEEIALAQYDVTSESICLYPDFAGAQFNFDNTGSSYCKVDLADFALLATAWLDAGLYPAD